MKIALVNLNRIQVPAIGPYAIDVLGSGLEKAGNEVIVLDLTKSGDPGKSIDDFFSENTPDLLGLTLRNINDVYFPSFLDLENHGNFLQSHWSLIERLKEHFPVDRIVLGGAGFSSAPEELLKRVNLKYGVRGPGEKKLIELADRYSRTGRISDRDSEVFDGTGTPLQTKVKRGFIDNQWYYQVGGLGSIRTSSGCAMKCSYCLEPNATGGQYALQNIDDVIYELDQLVEMGIYDIHTVDSEFNLPFHYSKAVLNAIIDQQYPKDVRFWAYCQPAPFDSEYAELLRKANFIGVNFGTDHSEEDILNKLNKWYGKDDIAGATKLCKENGIAVMHELLFGYPGDTPDKMFRAIDFMQVLDPHVAGVTIGIAALPGTELGKLYLRKKAKNELSGFYCSGEGLIDPTYYIDPSFKIPRIFDDLKIYVGANIDKMMIPNIVSTSSPNNQLIGSDRLKRQLQAGKKGAYWYHYRAEMQSKHADSTATQRAT